MKQINEIILVIASILIILSIFSDYKSNYFESARLDSINYVILANTYYIASHQFSDSGFSCAWSDMTYPEFQAKELKEFQDQADNLRGIVSKWNWISKLFLFLSMTLNIFVIINENKKLLN